MASQNGPALAADAGLELTTFVSGLDERRLAIELAPYADQPLPISHDLEELWDAHGLRMISLPIEDAEALQARLRTSGGSQRQWLGQAYSWTEAARGGDFGDGRIVALDAERIRLSAGSLRLLLRSWVEPVPPEPRVGMVSGSQPQGAGDLPGAVLRVELVPQHREARPDESARNPLTVTEPRIEAESQGLLFSRLFARMSMPAGRALLILPERPGTNWHRLSQQPDPAPAPAPPPATKKPPVDSTPENPWPKRATSGAPAAATTDEWSKVRPTKSSDSSAPSAPQIPAPKSAAPPASGAPRLGEVIRGPLAPPAPSAPDTEPASWDNPLAAGPAQARVATLGEAMLASTSTIENGAGKGKPLHSTQRTMILLVPHVPREFHLLAPAAATPPPSSGAKRSPE